MMAESKEEHTGSQTSYYTVEVADPSSLDPYKAECLDIIEALGMTFAEGEAFKAIWRMCAARKLGIGKRGRDGTGLYDAEKVKFYGGRMVVEAKRREKQA